MCIDCIPNPITQAQERDDVLNVGGFSDEIFKMIAAFAAGQMDDDHWAAEIDALTLYLQ